MRKNESGDSAIILKKDRIKGGPMNGQENKLSGS